MTQTPITIEWKINVVSAINFVALVGLLLTAVSTWFALVGRVDLAQTQLMALAEESKEARLRADSLLRTLMNLQETTNARLSRIEGAVEFQTKAIDRIENQDKPKP